MYLYDRMTHTYGQDAMKNYVKFCLYLWSSGGCGTEIAKEFSS